MENLENKIYEAVEFYKQGNYEKSFEIFNQLKDSKNETVLYYLACLYYEGKGTNKNIDLAHSFFLEVAEKGDKFAQYQLAKIYEKEYNNIEKAIYWYQKSSEQGDSFSQYFLAYIYALKILLNT